MTQATGWDEQGIIDRFLEGYPMVRLARMSGKTVREIKAIITRVPQC